MPIHAAAAEAALLRRRTRCSWQEAFERAGVHETPSLLEAARAALRADLALFEPEASRAIAARLREEARVFGRLLVLRFPDARLFVAGEAAAGCALEDDPLMLVMQASLPLKDVHAALLDERLAVEPIEESASGGVLALTMRSRTVFVEVARTLAGRRIRSLSSPTGALGDLVALTEWMMED